MLTLPSLFATTLTAFLGRGRILDDQELVPEPQTIQPPARVSVTHARPSAGPTPTRQVHVPAERVRTDGKFFRIGAQKFHPKGVTYGPFAPTPDGSPFPNPTQAARDFTRIRELNANCLRVYYVPPRWFLDLVHAHGLKVLVDFTWSKHTCFLDDPAVTEDARQATRRAAEALAGHPAVFALTLANEIQPDIARWYGAPRIEAFLDELAAIVKSVDPQLLVTFVNFPPTEFLQPASIDFLSFNVYLHDEKPFANYLDRLQSIAGGKPLVLAEFGMDSLREGDERKAQFLSGHIETAFRAGVAGTFIFAFTDDWFTGGHQIDNWFFGLTDRDRNPKSSFRAVAEQYGRAPHFPLPGTPRVSVVVASYNGGRTLPACLQSLMHLNYTNYEVILVDDGSTDDTAKIAAQFPSVITIHQRNLGLSAARNTGIRAAAGEIVAFTDSDCRVDEDWLYYIVADLLKTDACAIGGHNFPPPEDSWVAGVVAVSPGAPAHVMLDDRSAEHIPGCNMVFWKWALEEVNGFDPLYRAAGDDVDVCWRLLQRGYKIAFSHAGFVWHYRRHTVAAYLKQQRGYGVAESLLQYKHPEYFNNLGGMRWKGRIYNPTRSSGLFGRFVIYHGVFGSGLFQSMYTPEHTGLLSVLTSLEWHVIFTLGGALLAAIWPAMWPLPVLTLAASLVVAALAAARIDQPAWQRRFWSKPLIALLFLLQPIVRGWPRYAYRLKRPETPPTARTTVRDLAQQYSKVRSLYTVSYWNDQGTERIAFLHQLLALLDRDQWQATTDSGWDEFDVTIHGDRFTKVVVHTVSENHGGNQRLLRARLCARWTLPGKMLLWAVVAFVALFVLVAGHELWSLPAWLLVVATVGYLHLRTQRTLRLGIALCDLAAQEMRLIKVTGPNTQEQSPS
jgi:glycosyltransferase involved in cell wall biosynthesis